MNLDDVKTVLSVYEYRSFTEAAYLTFQSLSSVSKCVSRVEQELGGPLFMRSRSCMQLTPLGISVMPLLKEMAEAARETEGISQKFGPKEQASTLSVGFNPLFGTVGETDILVRFRKRNGDTDLRQVKRYSGILHQMVSEKQLDAAFLFYLGNNDVSGILRNINDDIGLVKIMDRKGTYIALSSDHPLAGRDSVRLSEFKDDIFIFNNAPQHFDLLGGSTRFIFNSEKDKFSIERMTRRDFLNRSMLREAIRSGYGVCPIACDLPEGDIEGISYVKVADSEVSASAYLCWNADNMSAPLEELIGIAACYAREKGVRQ